MAPSLTSKLVSASHFTCSSLDCLYDMGTRIAARFSEAMSILQGKPAQLEETQGTVISASVVFASG
jgi:hypothetical protein